MTGAPEWRWYTRSGEVTAVRIDHSWTWRTDAGDALTAAPGDWQVTDDTGKTWSVAADRFVETYRHVRADRWERSGTVSARPARTGEHIDTLEGPEVAPAGSFVVRGEVGELWVVPSGDFVANYRACH